MHRVSSTRIYRDLRRDGKQLHNDVGRRDHLKCVICRNAETEHRTTTVTLERGALTLVLKGVPAQVCPDCGEAYVSEEVGERLLQMAGDSAHAGVQLAIRQYKAA
jgi:YgiT-type zinc finger domain-containing protein